MTNPEQPARRLPHKNENVQPIHRLELLELAVLHLLDVQARSTIDEKIDDLSIRFNRKLEDLSAQVKTIESQLNEGAETVQERMKAIEERVGAHEVQEEAEAIDSTVDKVVYTLDETEKKVEKLMQGRETNGSTLLIEDLILKEEETELKGAEISSDGKGADETEETTRSLIPAVGTLVKMSDQRAQIKAGKEWMVGSGS
ncbi:uncharacterized protein LOC112083495 [Eutrema salsugineum]|uniref:uncharacterized protein LOC112083495 n=1 Tax=Eutrema salsugineum TaxID=72664 RepID=UPI000CED6474|nr:uncharacterized protein LOC112083495 [Eutrema salsugineum]